MRKRQTLFTVIIITIGLLITLINCTSPSVSTTPNGPEQPSSPDSATSSPNIAAATDLLKTISGDLYQTYLQFKIDENVADYIVFTRSLPEDFQIYALENRLCIQDHNLTDLEKQFLKEPEDYLRQIFNSYITELDKIDPELAIQLKKLPYFKTLEIQDVEALEDFLWLASIPEYKTTLETIYGKGIDRKMHSVALEALLWRAYAGTGAYDSYNPLDDSNYLPIFYRLADFQKKYNRQMDEAEIITANKPTILGINYVYEPMDWLKKTGEDVRFDYALMRWVIGANALKIWGQNAVVFDHVQLAHEEGLEVWLEFCPVYALETADPDISIDSYCERLARFTQAAEKAKAEVLVIGHEVDLHLKRFDTNTGSLKKAVDQMVKTARENYSGQVTYCTWSDLQGFTDVDWQQMDIIFPQLYMSDCNRLFSDKEYLDAILNWKNKVPGKPLAISEFGSLTISEAATIGPCDNRVLEQKVTYDPAAQADLIEKQLQVLLKADIHGIFFHMWDEQEIISVHGWDRNRLGFGIWDYKSQEPKTAFWSVYKYYKER